MKTAAVVIDTYKISTFRRVLDAAGYKYTEQLGPSVGTMILQVEYEWVKDLKPVIEQCEGESHQ